MPTVVNENSKIYYSGKYWNDYPQVLEYISYNFTGDKHKSWIEDFKERFAKKPFKHGLFLNCGNGWVERDFIDRRIVKKATAFDYSQELLNTAKKGKGKRHIYYFQADVNKVTFEENQFDLIVNVAALHHAQYINKLCYQLAKVLEEDGIMVNFDYIGPARNQYPLRQWFYVNKINNSLPDYIKKTPLDYPHLPTMLHDDPTEAIHSDLILESLSKYFDILERHDTAGGIAYIILTHNNKLENVSSRKLNYYIKKILAADKKYTDLKIIPPMFSYFIAKPNKKALLDKEKRKHYQKMEDLREKRAGIFAGVYNKSDFLKLIYYKTKIIIIGSNHERILIFKQGLSFTLKMLKK